MTTGQASTKEKIFRALEDLPDDATIEEAMDRLLLLYKIEQGLADVEAGRTLSHEEVLERIKTWRQ